MNDSLEEALERQMRAAMKAAAKAYENTLDEYGLADWQKAEVYKAILRGGF